MVYLTQRLLQCWLTLDFWEQYLGISLWSYNKSLCRPNWNANFKNSTLVSGIRRLSRSLTWLYNCSDGFSEKVCLYLPSFGLNCASCPLPTAFIRSWRVLLGTSYLSAASCFSHRHLLFQYTYYSLFHFIFVPTSSRRNPSFEFWHYLQKTQDFIHLSQHCNKKDCNIEMDRQTDMVKLPRFLISLCNRRNKTFRHKRNVRGYPTKKCPIVPDRLDPMFLFILAISIKTSSIYLIC